MTGIDKIAKDGDRTRDSFPVEVVFQAIVITMLQKKLLADDTSFIFGIHAT